MDQLIGLVQNRSRSEQSIIEGYVVEEVIKFYSDFLDGVEPIGFPKFRHEGRLQHLI
jgi:hypothetical protein